MLDASSASLSASAAFTRPTSVPIGDVSAIANSKRRRWNRGLLSLTLMMVTLTEAGALRRREGDDDDDVAAEFDAGVAAAAEVDVATATT